MLAARSPWRERRLLKERVQYALVVSFRQSSSSRRKVKMQTSARIERLQLLRERRHRLGNRARSELGEPLFKRQVDLERRDPRDEDWIERFGDEPRVFREIGQPRAIRGGGRGECIAERGTRADAG